MHVEPKKPTVQGPSEWFAGDVYIDAVHARKAGPSRMACGWVLFTPGARTAWHSHAVGQTLLITEGIALLGTRDGQVISQPRSRRRAAGTRRRLRAASMS